MVDHCKILHLVAAPTINRSDDGLISSAIGNTNNNHCSPCMTSPNILGHFIGIDTQIYVPGAALRGPNLMEVKPKECRVLKNSMTPGFLSCLFASCWDLEENGWK